MDGDVRKNATPPGTQEVLTTKPTAVEFGPALRDATLAWAAHLASPRRAPPRLERYRGARPWLRVMASALRTVDRLGRGLVHRNRAWRVLTTRPCGILSLDPRLIGATAPLVGGSEEIAGLLLANLACLAAFLVLRLLIEEEFDQARRASHVAPLRLLPTEHIPRRSLQRVAVSVARGLRCACRAPAPLAPGRRMRDARNTHAIHGSPTACLSCSRSAAPGA